MNDDERSRTRIPDFDLDLIDHEGMDEELSDEALAAQEEFLWKLENVELNTVGVDVGSSTSHLMFARVHLRRMGQELSSRFVVVNREVLWRSPIMLTPYRSDYTIDAETLGDFFHNAYREAGLERDDIDAGAIILTGEALKRSNSRAIADLFAAETGKFVCASAGHHMEAILAAHGSGAVSLSRQNNQTVLNVDIGGGTTKFALVRNGEILHTAAVAVGGRLVAIDEAGKMSRIEGPAEQAAEVAGISLKLGQPLPAEDQAKLVSTWVDVLVGLMHQDAPSKLALDLHMTDPMPNDGKADAVTFSGGVSEYIYGREPEGFHDLGPALAAALRQALDSGRIGLKVLDPGQGIRATVIGASQFSMQLSGNTISISEGTELPIRNLPVLHPRVDLSTEFTSGQVADAVATSVRRFVTDEGHPSVALTFRWQGDPLYQRLRTFADGVVEGMSESIAARLPLVLLLDGDVGKTIGNILKAELKVPVDVVSIDGLQLQEFDYVDVGEVIQPANTVPVVIKSLLFSGGVEH
ncbi:MAG TPA: ethanolamine ammonia-lyase reactivating factor EutA [Chloroflexota bacterium]|nr:ethanolamine ammonia-lyase reactivating factor EutA [Chloroflexota bacterium]